MCKCKCKFQNMHGKKCKGKIFGVLSVNGLHLHDLHGM